jgi:RNA polymerase sigma-70 factor (ECF subfamily)
MDDSHGTGRHEPRTDEALMLSFRDGDARAFEELVTRHRRGLFNFLLRSVQNRSRAEELLQEVFLRVVRSKDRYEKTAKLTTWLYTIARNLCVDESRRAKFRRTVSLDAPRRGAEDDSPAMVDTVPADQVATDEAAAAPQIRQRLAKAIDVLPEDQREVFLMRQISGLSFKEIGEIVGAPENTVKSRMRYALEKLRQELADFNMA